MRVPAPGATVWWVPDKVRENSYGPLTVGHVQLFFSEPFVALTYEHVTDALPLEDFWRRVDDGRIEFVKESDL